MGATKSYKDLISEYLSTGYIETLREAGCSASKNTIMAAESRLKKFTEYFEREAGLDITLLTPKMAKSFISFLLLDKELSRVTTRLHFSAAKMFFQWITADQGLLPFNPFVGIKAPKGTTSYAPCPLTEKELLDILAAEDDKGFRALWEVYAWTGVRSDEARTLLHENLDLERGVMLCHVKGGKDRPVDLDERAVRALRAYLGDGEHDPQSPVWPRRQHAPRKQREGQPFIARQTLYNRLRMIARRAGLEDGRMRTHLFRHTFATDLLKLTQNLRNVQDALGHKDIRTTQIYTHSDRNAVRELVHSRGKRMGLGVGAVGQ